MLINKMGVESEDDVVDLDSRRPVPNPKNRETMTILLRTALAPVPRSVLPKPTATEATVSSLPSDTPAVVESPHTDVA